MPTRGTVYAALAANLTIAVVKGVAGVLSGSSVMLAETAHSIADSANQGFLRISLSLADRKPDREHPFGHGKERFLWAFLAAILIFLSGAVFSIGRGLWGLLGGAGGEGGFVLNYAVLGFSAVAEGASLLRAYRQVRREAGERGQPLREFLGQSRDPTTKTVLFEDSTAVVGVLVAFAGVGLHQATGEKAFDAAASIAVGMLLAFVAFVLARDSRALLLGVAARPDELKAIERAIRAHRDVKELVDLRTMYLSPGSLLVAAKLDFAEDIDADRLEEATAELESELTRAVPEVEAVFIDARRRGAGGKSAEPARTRPPT
jgi:cation diffusion facilitator family transporter